MPTVPDIHRRGTRAAQATLAAPPLTVGTLYFVTDEGVTERWNGTAWESYSGAGGSGSGGPPAAHHTTHETGGSDAVVALAGSVITSGTLPDARLSVNVQMKPVAESDVTNLVSDLALKAPLASPALTGVPVAPTATAGTSTTQLATTAFVTAGLAGKPTLPISLTTDVTGTLQAAQEPAHTGDVTNAAGALALAIGASKVTNAMIAGPIPASKLVGTDLVVTESQVTNLVSDLALKAPLASPALTGTPTAPTATAGTSTTQLATTAFVAGAVTSGGAPAAHHVSHETGGSDALAALSAAILTSGTLPDARLSANVPLKNTANAFTAAQTMTPPLGVVSGGTGAATLAAHGVLVGEGTSAVAATGAGTVGQVFMSGGAAVDPAFQSPTAVQVGAGPALSGTNVMAGLNCTFTPKGTRALLIATGYVAGSIATASQASFRLCTGTGTPPVQGAALVGVQQGNATIVMVAANVGNALALIALVTGLSAGTPSWADIAMLANGGAQTVTVSMTLIAHDI